MRESLLYFPPFRLDLPNARLYKGLSTLPLQPKELRLLWYLASNAGRLISHDELLNTVWPGVIVTPGVLKVRIRRIRQALGDNPDTPHFIENVHGRGYRFLAAVATTPQPESSHPRFPLESSLPTADRLLPSFLVGREMELTRLNELFAKAAGGQRQIGFVTGEPGIGKTALVQAFLSGIGKQRSRNDGSALTDAQPLMPAPWIAQGQCLEHYGEPYMPVLEALDRFSQEFQSKHLVNLLSQHAPTWLLQMPTLLSITAPEALQRRTVGTTRERMLREFAHLLEALTDEHMLVLVLEDLHWADVSTLALLDMLARRREPARLLVLGTYRPTEVLGKRHPLVSVVQELQAHRLCSELALELLGEREVTAYFAKRFPQSLFPTRLAQALHRRTEGNPLFLVSVIEDLVTQGLLAQVGEGWVFQSNIEELAVGIPESIRHLVTRQRERLRQEEQQILEAASVAGLEFSVAAVAAALETDVVVVGDRCAQLAERQQFLRPAGIAEWPDGTVATRYGFLHALYQQLWHEQAPIEKRQRWHLRIGERKELAYGKRAGEIAAELAVHFEQGRDYRRAVTYLHHAGEYAIRRSASTEAIAYFTKGLEVLHRLPNSTERAQQELMVQVSLGPVLMMTKGRSATVVEDAYTRALELCQQTGEQIQLFSALRGLWECYETRGELSKAHELAEQFFTAAQARQDLTHQLIAHDALGDTLFWRGELALAQQHLERGVTLYDPHQHSALAFFHGGYDPGVACACLGACTVWLLGYVDQALTRMRAALTLARRLGQLHSLASALIWAAVLHQLRREGSLAQAQAETTIPLCREQEFPYYLAAGTILQGWALTEQGHGETGIAQLRQGLATCRALGVEMARTYFLGLLAGAYGKAGQPQEGLSVVAEALELANTNGERLCEAELWRLKGELLLQSVTDQ